MILSELFSQVNTTFRGSDDDVPAVGTTDYTLWLGTTNRKINEWARDGKRTWESLFEVRTVGTIATGTQSYGLDDILVPSDDVSVTKAGIVTKYNLVKPQERGRVSSCVYISGRDPKSLVFHDPILSTSSIIGGSITMGGIWLPANLTKGTDVIPVDDPYWLVYAVASELAFNDLTYQDKYPDLVNKANNLYSKMVSNNNRGTNNNPRTLRTTITRIPGSSR